MSWNYFNILCFRSVVVCYFLLSLVRDVHNLPYHRVTNFLGHDYWNDRYSLSYTEWDGFWNFGSGGRTEYNRPNSETSGNECTSSGCSCSNSDPKVTCTGSPTSL